MTVERMVLGGAAIRSRERLSVDARDRTDAYLSEIIFRRRRVVLPLFLLSFALFCATLIAFAYLPDLVAYRVYGVVNVAYCLALMQFCVTFLVAATYSYWAKTALDPLIVDAHRHLLSTVGERVR
ncbi:DUF485 domain-containing protein [Methylobacterium sp. Leaf118]|uniref:DUF485 domain-containing protein n=1 Tax=Methylobacterium sp. Leaf118 TaxID=2876562 RepID=UPI001E4CC554|nr:DUF485 domain-containing protein [Methylobacterium sp. Leaf118]